jgi:hypothetical protein
VSLAVSQMLWFQLNGDPGHYEENFQEWLDATYPGRWTGVRGPIVWPPLSPDLFLLWGHLKEHGDTVLPRLSGSRVKNSRSYDNGRCQHDKVNGVWRIALCLEMDVGNFEHLLQLLGSHGFII